MLMLWPPDASVHDAVPHVFDFYAGIISACRHCWRGTQLSTLASAKGIAPLLCQSAAYLHHILHAMQEVVCMSGQHKTYQRWPAGTQNCTIDMT